MRLTYIVAGKLRLERLDIYQITDLAGRKRANIKNDGFRMAESAGLVVQLVRAFVEKILTLGE